MYGISIPQSERALLREWLEETRWDWAGDPWGEVMGAWFDVAELLTLLGQKPSQFSPSPSLTWNTANPYVVELSRLGITADSLREFLYLLSRVSDRLREAGRSY